MDNTIEFYLKNPIIKHDVGILLVKDIQHRFVASNSGFSIFSGLPPENLIYQYGILADSVHARRG